MIHFFSKNDTLVNIKRYLNFCKDNFIKFIMFIIMVQKYFKKWNVNKG